MSKFFRSFQSCSACLLLGFLLSAVGAQESGEARQEITIPDDPDAIVIRLEIKYPDLETGSYDPAGGGSTRLADNAGGDEAQPRVAAKPVDPFKSGADGKSDTSGQSSTGTEKPPTPITQPPNSQRQDSGQSNQSGSTNQEGEPGPVVVQPVEVRGRRYVSVQGEDPVIEIYADGRVLCGRLDPESNPASSRLEQAQIVDLLDTIINDHQFFSLDSEAIKQAVEKDSRVDARIERRVPRFTITVTANGQQKQLSVDGLRAYAGIVTDSQPLQHAAAIERLLNNLFMTINVGGRENMIAILKMVNEKFDASFRVRPEAITPFTIDDATFIAVQDEGKMKLVFGKRGIDENNRAYRFVAVFSTNGKTPGVVLYGYN